MSETKKFKYKDVWDFQRKVPKISERKKILAAMSNEEIDKFISEVGMPQAKAWYAKFKK